MVFETMVGERSLPPSLGPPFDTTDHITRILSQDCYSLHVNVGGVQRADGARLESNSPCEDRYSQTRSLSPGNPGRWIASAVFDGHSGWQAADHLETQLLHWVERALGELKSYDEESIQTAIKEAFLELDRSMINNYINSANNEHIGLAKKMEYMQIAMSGSCALLSLYDSLTRSLYTACTGDSRAILGQQASDNKWELVSLSDDQKGDNETEIARIRQEHPGEEAVAENGRVLGMSVSRAFGDVNYKASHNVLRDLSRRFITSGPKEKERTPTPPYLTAEPVVTIAKIEQPAFLVLATDGLWDECTNEQVIDLVVRWLEAQPNAAKRLRMTPTTVWWKAEPQEPEEHTAAFDFLQRWDGFDPRFLKERTTIEDIDNVAVHLLRNACGGNHRQLLEGKLAARAPFARYVRDDMTVQVIFFEGCGFGDAVLSQ